MDKMYKNTIAMKVIDLLKTGSSFLQICIRAGIKADDVQYISLYDEYRFLTEQGEKVSYIVAVLAERYGISERKVYMLIKHMQSDCNPDAV